MPLFTFTCGSCNIEQQILARSCSIKHCEGCGSEMERKLPKGQTSTTYVTKDTHRGVQQKRNLEAQLTKRMRDHHDRYEVEEKIEKHGTDDMQQFGWDKKRKKL